MTFTVHAANRFSSSSDAKVMSVDKWDDECLAEINGGNTYSVIKFIQADGWQPAPFDFLSDIATGRPLNRIAIAGKDVVDLTGLVSCHVGIRDLYVGIVDRMALVTLPINKIKYLESVRLSYVNTVPLGGLTGALIRDLTIEEISGVKGIFNLAALPALEKLLIMKGGSISGIDISGSIGIRHLVISGAKRMDTIQVPALRPTDRLDYLSISKVPLSVAVSLASLMPKRVDLEKNDIFKSKLEAESVFVNSQVFFG